MLLIEVLVYVIIGVIVLRYTLKQSWRDSVIVGVIVYMLWVFTVLVYCIW